MTTENQGSSKKRVAIDFLFIDLTTCTRCRGKDASIEKALVAVAPVLESAGVEVVLRKILIDSEQKAMEYRFVSSPTIRVNDRDIATDLKESNCASCGEACGCGDGIECRDWIYNDQEYSIAPEPMIVDAILSAVYANQGTPVASEKESGTMTIPENLQKFFAGMAAMQLSACCSAAEQVSCCDSSEKGVCCGPTSSGTSNAGCGCR